MKSISKDIKDYILELYQEEGITIAEIAASTDVCVATINSIVKSSGIPMRREKSKKKEEIKKEPILEREELPCMHSKEKKTSVVVNPMMTNSLRMYDVVWVDMGSDKTIGYCGKHPAIIIQNNIQNFYSDKVIVMFGTSKIKKIYLPTNFVLQANSFGLMKDTMFMANQICTINKSKIFSYIGSIDDKEVKDMIYNAYLANMTGTRENLDMH